MLKIRLARFGRKRQPRFKIVAAEDSKPQRGKVVEILGNFNPQSGDFSFDKEKVLEYLRVGAQPTNAVCKLLKKQGLKHKLIVVKVFKAKSKKELEEEKKLAEEERVKKQAEVEKAKQEWEEKSAEIAVEAKDEKEAVATEEGVKEVEVKEAKPETSKPEKQTPQESAPAEKTEQLKEEE